MQSLSQNSTLAFGADWVEEGSEVDGEAVTIAGPGQGGKQYQEQYQENTRLQAVLPAALCNGLIARSVVSRTTWLLLIGSFLTVSLIGEYGVLFIEKGKLDI